MVNNEKKLWRFTNSLAFRYISIALVLIVTLQLLFSAYITAQNYIQQKDELEHKVLYVANFLGAVSTEAILGDNFLYLESLVKEATANEDVVYCVVVHTDGRALTRYLNSDDPIIKDAFTQASSNNILEIIEVAKQGSDIHEFKVPIITEQVAIGTVVIGYSLENIQENTSFNIVANIGAAIATSMILISLTILLFRWQISAPLDKVAMSAVALANGDLSQQLEEKGSNELQDLIQAFNSMARQLAQRLDEILAEQQHTKIINEVLRKSEAEARKLSLVASRTDNIVIISDAVGNIEWVNEAFEKITGYTLNEVVGKTPGSILQGPDSDTSVIDYMRSQLQKENGFTTEILNYKKTGEEYWVEVEVQPSYDENGQLINFIALERDVTEQKRFAQHLRESEARNKAIVETAADGIITINEQGIIETFNPAASTLFGYASKEVLGQNISLLMPEVHRAEHVQRLRNYKKTGNRRVIGREREIHGLHKAGTIFPMQIALTETLLDDRKIFTGIVRDLTAIEKAEKDRDRKALQYRALFEKTSDAVFIIDLSGNHLDVNQQASTLLGYSINELRDMMAVDIVSDSLRSESEKTRQSLLAEETIPVYEHTLRHKSGREIPVEVNMALVSDSDGMPVHIQSVVRDISARKEAENLKDAFVSNVSHELRTPLSVLALDAGNLERLYERLEDNQRLQMIHNIRNQIAMLSELIEKILQISRLSGTNEVLALKTFSFTDLAQEEINRQAKLARNKQITISFETSKDIEVKADPVQIGQVIRNLINNAIKYTSEAGYVACQSAVVYGNSSADDTWPGISELKTGPWLGFRVEDSGIGIDANDIKKLFKRFYRVENQSKVGGTGLGLTISNEIIQRHKGHLMVSSELGKGSVFAFYLPLELESD